MVLALLEAGADVNAQSGTGPTPLHAAAAYSKTPAVVTALLAGGADPTAKTPFGQTPFDLAEENDKLKGTEVYWRLNDARYNK